jgi:hypothetical protein
VKSDERRSAEVLHAAGTSAAERRKERREEMFISVNLYLRQISPYSKTTRRDEAFHFSRLPAAMNAHRRRPL